MMKNYDDIILSFMLKMNPYGVVQPLVPSLAYFMNNVRTQKQKHQRLIAGFFTTPYVMQAFNHVSDTIILAHQKDSDAVEGFFEVVFGKIKAEGKVPVRW